MSLLYASEHLSCIHYQRESPLTKAFSYKNGETIEFTTLKDSILLFLKKGCISVSYGNFFNEEVAQNNIVFLPESNHIAIHILEDADVVTLAFDIQVSLCENFSMIQLYPYCADKKPGFSVLPFNQQLKDYLCLLDNYISDGVNCCHLYMLKKQELFYLFRVYYTKETLAAFFHPILNKEDLFFKKIVLEKALTVKTVSELASLANYSTSGFIKKFERCFDDSPYRWIMSYKASHILQEINRNELPFKDICEKYQFSSMPHFIEFCKRHYGLTPGKLRSGSLK
ncbi:helix-turn-helix transcriptional regulator [Viscerimonas tarda]